MGGKFGGIGNIENWPYIGYDIKECCKAFKEK